MNFRYLFTFLIISFATKAQNNFTEFKGKIVNIKDAEDVYIQNLNTKQSVYPYKGGYFTIKASRGDTLIFAGVSIIGKRYLIKDSDLNKGLNFVSLKATSEKLEELFIDRTITAKSLGIPTGYVPTPEERRLITATSSAGGIIPIDAIINAISGRTKMLKRAVMYQRERSGVDKLVNKFAVNFYTDVLKIPEEYIEAYGYYLQKDKEVKDAAERSDLTLLRFLFIQNVENFKKLNNLATEKIN